MGIVLRVSRQDSHRIQQQNGSAVSIIRASKASGVWFSTPAIDLLGAKWKSLKRSYEDAEASLVDFLTFEFQTPYQEMLDKVACCIAELDVLVSFALVSHKHKFVRSSTSDLSSSLLLREIFDPFVQNGTGDGGDADASRIITIELSLDDGKSFLLLDGHLKSSHNNIVQLLGIIIILNQLGCFVPCKEAVLPVFDAIFLRTGAYDQQLYGFSTFMTEMRQMSHIFAAMTPNSLVLVEDLCRGTSTCTSPPAKCYHCRSHFNCLFCSEYLLHAAEGLALALSMCFHLMESKTITCFSSQWRELTERLIVQPATATLAQIQPAIIDFGAGQSLNQSSQAEFEKLMRDCDLPQDLIALIHEEMKR
ncbi:unnamed protein product [Phytophthora lilii]|uniref:Unnamed protein product n=1 Tax=Phytophthora lilii TaxID=2077276 RepID=A0A9W6TSD2_9STRA|nr:unnamed protein product [Phytophthora lilii]